MSFSITVDPRRAHAIAGTLSRAFYRRCSLWQTFPLAELSSQVLSLGFLNFNVKRIYSPYRLADLSAFIYRSHPLAAILLDIYHCASLHPWVSPSTYLMRISRQEGFCPRVSESQFVVRRLPSIELQNRRSQLLWFAIERIQKSFLTSKYWPIFFFGNR